jgi:hypothetical protein
MIEGMKDMKNIKIIGYTVWVIGMLLVGMPVMAQQQEWRSTSSMQGTGSTLSPQVQAVGALSAPSMATTTSESYFPSHSPSGPNRFPRPGETGQSEEYPIGDAMLPLMLCAVVFCGVIALRRKRFALHHENEIRLHN